MTCKNTGGALSLGLTNKSTTQNSREQRDIMRFAMGYLPYIDRVAIILRYWENCSIEEISQFLGTSWDETDKRLIRSMRLLRGAIKHFAKQRSLSKLKTALTSEQAAMAA